MITEAEILMGRARKADLSPKLQSNLAQLLKSMNVIRASYGKPMKVTSGYRPPTANQAAGGAKASAHLECLAVDISDTDGRLWQWCLSNLELLKANGLYIEDKRWSPTWVHFQARRPASGKRIFVPSTAPPVAPKLWNGQYDSQFDS